jgi:hypothetical protein
VSSDAPLLLNIKRRMNMNDVQQWLVDNERELLEFEAKLLKVISLYNVNVEYQDELKEGGQLQYSYSGTTGMITRKPTIAVPREHLEKYNGVPLTLIRIVTLAHEFGHWLDIKENYDENIFEFEESGEIIQEQDAWQLAVDILDKYGFDRFGYMGWKLFRRRMIQTFATYYYEECNRDIKEAKRKAKNYANLLLQFKRDFYQSEVGAV